jgi:DNA repair photolyase
MSFIYEPRGKAREYSPLAVNLYSGCGHKCSYCYVPGVIHMDRKDFDEKVKARDRIIEGLKKEAAKMKYSDKQVFMSFTTDPYNPINDELKLTRKALEIFLENKIPVSILTKSGLKALQDLDIIKQFGKHIKIGASLTYDNDTDSNRVERGAALPGERLEMLKRFHDEGVRTWVSFEPILQPKQMYNLLLQSLSFVSEYQFGKLSDEKRTFDWDAIVLPVADILREKKIPFYIKETLRKEISFPLLPEEIDQDYLTLPPFDKGEYKENLFEYPKGKD